MPEEEDGFKEFLASSSKVCCYYSVQIVKRLQEKHIYMKILHLVSNMFSSSCNFVCHMNNLVQE